MIFPLDYYIHWAPERPSGFLIRCFLTLAFCHFAQLPFLVSPPMDGWWRWWSVKVGRWALGHLGLGFLGIHDKDWQLAILYNVNIMMVTTVSYRTDDRLSAFHPVYIHTKYTKASLKRNVQKPNPALCEQGLRFGGSGWRQWERRLCEGCLCEGCEGGGFGNQESHGNRAGSAPSAQGSQGLHREALQPESAADRLPVPTRCWFYSKHLWRKAFPTWCLATNTKRLTEPYAKTEHNRQERKEEWSAVRKPAP